MEGHVRTHEAAQETRRHCGTAFTFERKPLWRAGWQDVDLGFRRRTEVAEKLDAASGMPVCRMMRVADGTVGSGRPPEATGFPAVAHAFGLPAA